GLVSAEISPRIVGGSDATYGDHYFIGSLQKRSGTSWYHICGAVIYNENIIVTAAHCLENGVPINMYRVRVGDHKLNNYDEGEGLYMFSAMHIHPYYNRHAPGYPNDIACMRTSTPISFNNYVGSITFDTAGSWAGQLCTLWGWGRTSGGGPLSNTLQQVNITAITNTECASRWSVISSATINSGHICFYSGSGASACSGDGGGPATCGNTLVGIASWGINTCDGSLPSVYTRVSQFSQWLATC
ncbi:hypothetical protein BaRGS_00032168, partial [Batillaria attramentaria]